MVYDPTGLNNQVVCHTGISVEIPKGYVGLLFPRSSVSAKPLSLANSVGVLDQDYRGEIIFKFRFTGNSNIQWEKNAYKVGERIGQLLVLPSPQVELEEVDELEETKRGKGGYGSTGA